MLDDEVRIFTRPRHLHGHSGPGTGIESVSLRRDQNDWVVIATNAWNDTQDWVFKFDTQKESEDWVDMAEMTLVLDFGFARWRGV